MSEKWFVYFISCKCKGSKMTKIGMAKDPRSRILYLQVGNPFLLKLESSIECRSKTHARNLEAWFHKCFSRQHIRGEWFKSEKLNVPYAIAGFRTQLEVENVKNKGIHGSVAEDKIKKLQSRAFALEKTVRQLNQSIDDRLDIEMIINMPEL